VTAFANTAGGHLVIGIEEADGVAAALRGITSSPADDEIRRLESILENGVEPRLVGVRIRPVPLSAGGMPSSSEYPSVGTRHTALPSTIKTDFTPAIPAVRTN